ncbi:17766_t:CDS:1, partial [Gigaspora rosea]
MRQTRIPDTIISRRDKEIDNYMKEPYYDHIDTTLCTPDTI